MLATILVLYSGKILNTLRFPDISLETLQKIWPLPLFYLGNLIFGLGGTQALSLPMFTVLRRFSILMTMIGLQLIMRKILQFCYRWILHSPDKNFHISPSLCLPHDIWSSSGSFRWSCFQHERVRFFKVSFFSSISVFQLCLCVSEWFLHCR